VEEKQTYRQCLAARSFRLGLLISLVVVFLIAVAVVTTASVLLLGNATSSKSPSSSRQLTLEDVFDSKFSTLYYSAEWTNDNQLLHQSSEDGVLLIDPSSNTTTVLISSTEWTELGRKLGSKLSSVVLSADRQMALLVTNREQVYRHSYVADYSLYTLSEDPANRTLSNISVPDNATGSIQLALWSPTQHSIAYVLDYNIYVYNVTSDELITVTTDGREDVIYNGIPDWLYEEEILQSPFALWWAPDGNSLLYGRFDDSSVEDYQFPLYGSNSDPSLTQYTTIDRIAYPKPGTTNPLVTVFITDLTTLTNHTLTPPPDTDQDHYLVFGGWLNSSVAMVTWMNRSSDTAVYCLYSESSSWQCTPIYNQTSPLTPGWIELVQSPTILEDGGGDGTGSILTFASRKEGDDSFLHILELSQDSDSEVSWRTNGSWEDTSIVRATNQEILYLSTKRGPSQRHLYSTRSDQCLTCSQDGWDVPKSSNPSIPSRCDYFSASCSPSLGYCLLTCSGPAIPYTLLAQYDGDTLTPVTVLENNSALHEAVSQLSLPTVEEFTVPQSETEGPSLNGQLMLPPDFHQSRQYPVLVYVYGGPYSQQVADRSLLSSLSLVYLCSNLSLIVAKVDGRGTGFRGDNFKYAVYKNLGHFETIDQIRAGRNLQSMKFVDGSRLAIYGASYGGYMAGMVGSSGSGAFSAAISQSPVTTWYYYDSAYTERYMDLPQNNRQAYEESSVLYRAGNLSDVDYLLIHGTGDDNVHFQNTAQLVQALTEKEVQFRVQFYTDKAHSLSGQPTRYHLYELIRDFLAESFDLRTT
jgi:dipeptidyl aminopeptidase/acylaminoacyl peptidase